MVSPFQTVLYFNCGEFHLQFQLWRVSIVESFNYSFNCRQFQLWRGRSQWMWESRSAIAIPTFVTRCFFFFYHFASLSVTWMSEQLQCKSGCSEEPPRINIIDDETHFEPWLQDTSDSPVSVKPFSIPLLIVVFVSSLWYLKPQVLNLSTSIYMKPYYQLTTTK